MDQTAGGGGWEEGAGSVEAACPEAHWEMESSLLVGRRSWHVTCGGLTGTTVSDLRTQEGGGLSG